MKVCFYLSSSYVRASLAQSSKRRPSGTEVNSSSPGIEHLIACG